MIPIDVCDSREQTQPEPIEQHFQLSAEELARIQFAPTPAEELARIAGTKASVRGSFSAGDEVGDEVSARLQGVRGLTDLRVNFKTGVLQVVVEPAPLLPPLSQCRLAVEIAAIVLVVLSIVGYMIFFSRRRRQR
jgi:hypothetical protein